MVKRKAESSAHKAGKVTPSPVDFDGEDSGDGYVGTSSAMLDPMIDPTDSEGSDEEQDDDSSDLRNGDDSAEEFDGAEELDGAEEAEEMDERPAKRVKATQPVSSNGQSAPLHSSSSSSNTFNLQLSALLESTLLPTTPNPALSNLLTTLHDTLLSLPSIDPLSPAKALKQLKGKIPEIAPAELRINRGKGKGKAKEVQWKLGFEKPSEVFVGGSWSVCGGYKKGKGVEGDVELVVVMPESLFSAKDRTDFRYHHKRAFYLAVIRDRLEAISKKNAALKGAIVSWTLAHGDERRPIVTVTAGKEQGLKRHIIINIHAAPPPSLFSPASLSPGKSLIRTGSESASPTANYASSIAMDTLHRPHLDHLHRLSRSFDGSGPSSSRTVASFLALWRIWAKRRGISASKGGSGWFAQMALGWVAHGGEVDGVGGQREKTRRKDGLGYGLGHWGALRAAWQFLAETDFEQTSVFMRSTGSPIPREDFVQGFEQVWSDPTGRVNILAEWEAGEIDLLRYHARETLAMLEDESVDSFADIFLRDRLSPAGMFDELIVVDLDMIAPPTDLISQVELPSRGKWAARSFGRILRRGLTDRVRLVHCVSVDSRHLLIGLVYNPAQATRVLDVGPPSSDKVATEAFRLIWGDKAELRRFKDGSISESVVWPISRPEDAAAIPGLIVQHLLGVHFSVPASALSHVSSNSSWREVLQVPDSARHAVCTLGAERLGFRPVLDGYDELYKLFKSLDDDLPLNILTVSPSSELLRYSMPFTPHPIDLPRVASASASLRYIPAADLVLQFESSPRWPDDLAAVQKVKLALLEKLARLVAQRLTGSVAQIVLDPHASEIEDPGCLEVVLPKGLAYRVRIYHQREQTLLLRALSGEAPTYGTALPQPPARLARPALQAHLDRFVHLPAHHQALAPLHHRYPSYSTATRLAKRWLAAHMLSPHVRPEAVELLTASVYLDPKSQGVPASGVGGFIRVLHLLAGWEGRNDALVVPVQAAAAGEGGRVRPSKELRIESAAAVSARKAAAGSVSPAPLAGGAWAMCTEDDPAGLRWTRDRPCTLVASRIRALAASCVAVLRESESTGVALDVKGFFRPPLEGYDVLLRLLPGSTTRGAEAVDPDTQQWEGKTYRNLVGGTDDHGAGGARVAYDTAGSFVSDLQRLYGDTIIPFYDAHGGQVIGLLWNPAKEAPRGLKPFLGYVSQPTDGQAAMVRVDRKAIVGEILRLGRGIISSVDFGTRSR